MKWKNEKRNRQEREANYFAMCLLMPEDMVRKQAKLLGPIDIVDGVKIKMLARIFRVSESMMALRLGQIFRNLGKL